MACEAKPASAIAAAATINRFIKARFIEASSKTVFK
jgi:hypothetical protein